MKVKHSARWQELFCAYVVYGDDGYESDQRRSSDRLRRRNLPLVLKVFNGNCEGECYE